MAQHKPQLITRQAAVDLDIISKRYGQRPSALARGNRQDFQFDMLIAQIGVEDESKRQEKALKEAQRKAKRR